MTAPWSIADPAALMSTELAPVVHVVRKRLRSIGAAGQEWSRDIRNFFPNSEREIAHWWPCPDYLAILRIQLGKLMMHRGTAPTVWG